MSNHAEIKRAGLLAVQRDAVPRKCERCKKLTRYRTRMGDPICEVCA